jgi:hypothetical protein
MNLSSQIIINHNPQKFNTQGIINTFIIITYYREIRHVTGGWRKLHNELYILYSSPSIIRMIKSRKTRSAGNVAKIVENMNVYSL